MPKISIIIPVYNMERFLKEGLDSVKNQTLQDLEIICVNDCSKDNSLEILREYQKEDSRFKIIDLKENRGQGYARNLGIKQALGDYIMFLDPDDLFELCACQKAYEQITKYDNDIVFYNFRAFLEGKNVQKGYHMYDCELEKLKGETSANIYNADIPYIGYAWPKIYRTKFLQENNCEFSISRMGEDLPFAIETTMKAKSISFLNERLYKYRKYKKLPPKRERERERRKFAA